MTSVTCFMSHVLTYHVCSHTPALPRSDGLCHMSSDSCVWWVMSHMWMSHVTYMNEACHTYEWISHNINKICVWWVMSHVWFMPVTHEHKCLCRIRWNVWVCVCNCMCACMCVCIHTYDSCMSHMCINTLALPDSEVLCHHISEICV